MSGSYRLTWLFSKQTMSSPVSPPAYLTRSAELERPSRPTRPTYTARSFTDDTRVRPAYHSHLSTEDISYSPAPYIIATEDVYSRSSSPTLAQYDEYSITVERYQAARRALPNHDTIARLRAAHTDLGKAVRTKPYIHLFDELLAKLRSMPHPAEIDELKEVGRVTLVRDGQSPSAWQLRQEVKAMNRAMEMWQEVECREIWQELTVQARNAIVAMSCL